MKRLWEMGGATVAGLPNLVENNEACMQSESPPRPATRLRLTWLQRRPEDCCIVKYTYMKIQAHTNAHPRTNAQPPPRLYEQIMRRLWANYERVIHFEFWNRGSEVSEKNAWATYVSSLRPDIQSVLTNVRPTMLDTNAGDMEGQPIDGY